MMIHLMKRMGSICPGRKMGIEIEAEIEEDQEGIIIVASMG